MSSQTTSSPCNFQLIINALADYTKQTGIDLTKSPFVEKIELSNSAEAILDLLKEREKAFKEYRDVNPRLISCLTPAVKILHAFSGALGGTNSLVSIMYHSVALLTWPRSIRSPSHQQMLCSRVSIFSSMYVLCTRSRARSCVT